SSEACPPACSTTPAAPCSSSRRGSPALRRRPPGRSPRAGARLSSGQAAACPSRARPALVRVVLGACAATLPDPQAARLGRVVHLRLAPFEHGDDVVRLQDRGVHLG